MEKDRESVEDVILIEDSYDVMDYISVGDVFMKLEKILDLKGLNENKIRRKRKNEILW